MKTRANTLFALGLASGLALLTFWLERIVRAPGPAQPSEVRQDPDYIVENLAATKLDRMGRPETTLTARRMRYFLGQRTSELDEPRLLQLRDTGPPLHLAADRGIVLKDGEEVRLYGNVVVSRDATPGRAELRIETTYLEVFPKAETARTPELVVIREGRSQLAGVGMDFNNKLRQLELKSTVTGTFQRDDG